MERTTKKDKDVDFNWSSRAYRSLCYLGLALGLIGCTTIKKAGVTATAAAAGATAGTVLSGGVAAPILGATTTAFVVIIDKILVIGIGVNRFHMTMLNTKLIIHNF